VPSCSTSFARTAPLSSPGKLCRYVRLHSCRQYLSEEMIPCRLGRRIAQEPAQAASGGASGNLVDLHSRDALQFDPRALQRYLAHSGVIALVWVQRAWALRVSRGSTGQYCRRRIPHGGER